VTSCRFVDNNYLVRQFNIESKPKIN